MRNLHVLIGCLLATTSYADELVLRNWGLDNNEKPSHISVRQAWKITKGSRKIKVAVIDTGIDANHPDLKDNICRDKKGEYGYDFVENKPNPSDKHGHGTHVAGIIGATSKAKAGAAGVALNVCMIAIRFYSDTATGAQNLSNSIKAINYAIDHGANIINYSGGGAEFNVEERKAIQRAEAKGILFVAAAGNEYSNMDNGDFYYPAAYKLSNIISVAATNINGQIIPASNWGKSHVHVAAPGENIFSTLPKNRYGYLTGTSQAAPFVTGIATLILSKYPNMKPADVIKAIIKSSDLSSDLKNKVMANGHVNAVHALQLSTKIYEEKQKKRSVAGK